MHTQECIQNASTGRYKLSSECEIGTQSHILTCLHICLFSSYSGTVESYWNHFFFSVCYVTLYLLLCIIVVFIYKIQMITALGCSYKPKANFAQKPVFLVIQSYLKMTDTNSLLRTKTKFLHSDSGEGFPSLMLS